MDTFYKSKTAIIIISLAVFFTGLICSISNGYFSLKDNYNQNIYSYNADNIEISVFVGGAAEQTGWYTCNASMTYQQLFALAQVLDSADVSSFNLSNKLYSSKTIILKSIYDVFDINTADEADMLFSGISPEVVAKIVLARGAAYLDFNNLVKNGILTETEFNEYKYRLYSI
jgi:hypothetical protein